MTQWLIFQASAHLKLVSQASTMSSLPQINSSPLEYSKICENKKTTFWLVDDRHVYRYKETKTRQGFVSKEPINGALFAFNPKTGQLLVKITPVSLFAKTSNLAKLIKQRTGEALEDLLNAVNGEELPKQVFVTTKDSVEPLKVALAPNFSKVSVTFAEINVPFEALLKLVKVGGPVLEATEPQVMLFNLYDNWQKKSITSYDASVRMMVILEGITLDTDNMMSLHSREGVAGGYPPVWGANKKAAKKKWRTTNE